MAMFARAASTLLFGLAANLDNLTIGLAYGLQGRRIGPVANLLIAAATTAVTLLALGAGRQIRTLLPADLPNIAGGALLAALAAWNLYHERNGGAEKSARYASRFAERRAVGVRESLFLAGVLSVNNLGLAVAGGIGAIGYLPAMLSVFFWSIALLALGQALSRRLGRVEALRRAVRSPLGGNAVLLLAALAMLAGY